MKKTDIINLNTKGYTVLRNWTSDKWINDIKEILPKEFKEHKEIRESNNNGIISDGVAMNIIASNDLFIEFLTQMQDRNLIKDIEKHYFKGECILNSFTAISNIPSESSLFYKKVHRDIRAYSGSANILLNMLVMVDDFSAENGGTLLLPYSHLNENEPTKDFWEENNVPITGMAGDIIIWNSNIFHASGINKTKQDRRGLPITFSLPYYKQLLDYPRALGYRRQSEFNLETQKLLGYHSRVPSSIKEWYAPSNKIMYK
jgi:ectoine hydroxylase-related dioxygenase (phytanoyl-CoA dioxygenase family)